MDAIDAKTRRQARFPPQAACRPMPGPIFPALNALLADTFALYLKTKNFH